MNTRNLHIPSNKVCDIERYCFLELADIYPPEEIQQMVRMLFEEYLGWSLPQMLLNRQSTINQSDLLKFHWAVEDLKQQRPIQHIIGHTTFLDCLIHVNKDVLIPRPETEEIVSDLIQSGIEPRSITDLCTGSGCIAIALKKQFPNATVNAIDLSDAALATANRNANDNHVDINFIKANVLDTDLALPPQHLIISNPPYVMRHEAAKMHKNVLNFEPAMALWVSDDDPLVFYHAIAEHAKQHLTPNGLLVVEINQHLGPETKQLFEEVGFQCQLRKDFRGSDRCLWATLSDENLS